MPRTARVTPGGMVFHVLNRGVGRRPLFDNEGDYDAFERIIAETLDKCPMRICGYCLMPNHWHFVMWPEGDDDLRLFMQRLSVTHVTRWQTHRQVVGEGHLYQARFKSFPVETDDYFYQVMRYVERNALRANLCETAQDWRWGSLHARVQGTPEQKSLLSDWPVPRPRQWVERVNRPQSDKELDAIRKSLARGQPLGSPAWVQKTASDLGLESTIRPRGRPRKQEGDE
jgi:putative transposase